MAWENIRSTRHGRFQSTTFNGCPAADSRDGYIPVILGKTVGERRASSAKVRPTICCYCIADEVD